MRGESSKVKKEYSQYFDYLLDVRIYLNTEEEENGLSSLKEGLWLLGQNLNPLRC